LSINQHFLKNVEEGDNKEMGLDNDEPVAEEVNGVDWDQLSGLLGGS